VQAYAMARLPQATATAEPALEMAGAGAGVRKDSGIIEID